MTGLHTHTFRLPIIAAAVAATAAAATPAIACGDEDRRVIIGVGDANVEAHANAVFVGEGGDHVIEMRVENGEVSVTIDGEVIDHDRVRTDKGKVIVLDEDGNEIKSLNLFMSPGDTDFVMALPGGQQGFQWQFDGTRPTVMIGVHLADPGEALRKHLRLDPGEGTMISGLYDGLAAQRAGLQQFDIIVTVDGESVNNPGTVLEALSEVEAGDEVTLGVIQSGRHKQFSVTVDAFDAERMNVDGLIGGRGMLRMQIPNLDFQFEPGQFELKRFLVDPDKNDVFVPDLRFGHRGDDHELDDRLQHLNQRMEELHEMIDRLVDEARQREE